MFRNLLIKLSKTVGAIIGGTIILLILFSLFIESNLNSDGSRTFPTWVSFIIIIYWIIITYFIWVPNSISKIAFPSIFKSTLEGLDKQTDFKNEESDYINTDSEKQNEEHDHYSYQPNQNIHSNGAYNQDFVKTIMLERYSRKPQPIFEDSSSYPIVFKEVLGLVNPYKEYINLVNEGYIIEASLSTKLVGLKKEQLINISNQLGLPINGNKQDIIKRIMDVKNINDLISYYIDQNTFYTLSEKGIKYLNDNFDFVGLYRSYDLNKSQYFSIRKELRNRNIYATFNDIATIIYSQTINDNLTKQHFSSARYNMDRLARIRFMEGDERSGLHNVIFSFILLLSGVLDNGYIASVESINSNLNQNYIKLTSFKIEDIENAISDILFKINLPFQKFDNELIKKFIIDYYINGQIDFYRYKRFEKKPIFITEFGAFWKNPY